MDMEAGASSGLGFINAGFREVENPSAVFVSSNHIPQMFSKRIMQHVSM
jgi:hypothetical protein